MKQLIRVKHPVPGRARRRVVAASVLCDCESSSKFQSAGLDSSYRFVTPHSTIFIVKRGSHFRSYGFWCRTNQHSAQAIDKSRQFVTNANCRMPHVRVPNIVFSRVPLNIMVICIRVTLKSSGYQPMSELLMTLPFEGARYV